MRPPALTKSPNATQWMTVHNGQDPATELEARLSGAVGRDCRSEVFAAIRSSVFQGRGPSVALLAGLMRESGADGISDTLQLFRRTTSGLMRHYNGKTREQFSHRPGIFRFESMLRMRRMLMVHLEALMIQPRPDIKFMMGQLNKISGVVSMMGGMPEGFGLQHLLGDVRDAASRFAETTIGNGDGALSFLQKNIDSLQAEWPLEGSKPEFLSDGFVEEVFFSEGEERSVQRAVLLDIIRHSDELLRNPSAVIGRALEREWRSVDAYLVSQFSHRYGLRYMPEDLSRADDAKLDLVGAMNYDDSWKSYQIMWEMLRALGRQGENARTMLPKIVDRFVFLTSVLSSYVAILEQGNLLHSGKGRMVKSLKDMPEFEELIVLTDAVQAIDPKTVAGDVLRELNEWLRDTRLSPDDRGYAIWRLRGVIPSDDIEDLARVFGQLGISQYVPRRIADPNMSDFIHTQRSMREFSELVGTVRDLSSTAEESARAIEQLGFRGGRAAAGLLREIVISAPPQLMPRDDAPAMIVPSPEFMGNTHYWNIIAPVAIDAMSRLGVDIPRSIISATNFSYVRSKTRFYGTGKEG